MTKKDPVKTQLRIPPELHARLNNAIAKSGRSMNAEIVARLEETFPETFDEQLLERRFTELDELERKIGEENLNVAFAQTNLANATQKDGQEEVNRELQTALTRLDLLTSLARSVREDIARLTSARSEFDKQI